MKDLLSQADDKEATATGSGRNSPALASSSRKTEAERRFEEVQKRRVRFALIFRVAEFIWRSAARTTHSQACAQNTQGSRERVQRAS